MYKRLAAILTGFFCFTFSLFAQPTFSITSLDANPGDTVDIDVTVDDFEEYISMQYSINWDTAVLDWLRITNLTDSLPDFGIGSVGTPNNIGNGNLTVSWFDFNFTPRTLDNQTVLFTIEYEVIGAQCDSTGIVVSSDPLAIEVADSSEVNVGLNAIDGGVNIPGINCVLEIVTITASSETGENGQEVCVKFTATDFTDIGAMQFTISYDASVLAFDRAQNFNIPGLSTGNFNDVGGGRVTVVWFDQNGSGVDVTDGTILFELCFDIIGSGGQASPITFIDDPLEIEIANGDGQPIETNLINGLVTVEGDIEGFALIVPDTSLANGPGEMVCIPITVNDFDSILSMQFSINFDSTLLRFDHAEGFNPADLEVGDPSAPAVDNGQLTVVWFDLDLVGVSLPNGTSIVTLCFEVIGECGSSSFIDFSSNPLDIEVSNSNDEVLTVALDNGVVFVDCSGCGFTIDAINDPICNGESTGSVFISVFGCEAPVGYSWTNANGDTVGTDQDLIDVPAGTYTVTITSGNPPVFIIPDPFVLTDPDPISIDAFITNEDMGNDGAIDITVSGGPGGPGQIKGYLWDDADMSITEDLINIAAGSYSVTITYNNGCQFVAGPFTVLAAGISLDITDVACFGDATGKIDLTMTAGQSPFTFLWSNMDTTEDICDLLPGTFSVTVTDANNDTFEATGEVTGAQNAISFTLDTTEASSAGNDGAIDLMVAGGELPYSYLWSNADTTEDISGLSPGEYCVTITDNRGCEVVGCEVILGDALIVQIQGSDFNGFGVSCFGECDGELIAMTINGIGNVSYVWSFENSTTQSLIGLCAGTYMVTATDELNREAVASYEIIEPTQLNVDIQVTDASGPGVSDGVLMSIVTGGIPPYNYLWNDAASSTTSSLQNQGAGMYVLIVTDENNCENMQTGSIGIEGIPCYEAISVITPNGDEKNDRLIIQCIFDQFNRLRIFNRWGGLEYEMQNYDNNWNGVNQDGERLTDGGYHWVLEVDFQNGVQRIFTGTVAVIRSLN